MQTCNCKVKVSTKVIAPNVPLRLFSMLAMKSLPSLSLVLRSRPPVHAPLVRTFTGHSLQTSSCSIPVAQSQQILKTSSTGVHRKMAYQNMCWSLVAKSAGPTGYLINFGRRSLTVSNGRCCSLFCSPTVTSILHCCRSLDEKAPHLYLHSRIESLQDFFSHVPIQRCTDTPLGFLYP